MEAVEDIIKSYGRIEMAFSDDYFIAPKNTDDDYFLPPVIAVVNSSSDSYCSIIYNNDIDHDSNLYLLLNRLGCLLYKDILISESRVKK